MGLRPLAKASRIARGARVAVIGAGPVGLAAAVALRRRGLSDITVYERAPKLAPLGTAWRPRPWLRGPTWAAACSSIRVPLCLATWAST